MPSSTQTMLCGVEHNSMSCTVVFYQNNSHLAEPEAGGDSSTRLGFIRSVLLFSKGNDCVIVILCDC